MNACRHATNGEGPSLCMKSSSRSINGVPSLLFHRELEFLPVVCDKALFMSCPFREGPDGRFLSSRGTLVCPHCGKSHIPGSLSGRLCREWDRFKKAYKEMKDELPGKRKYFVAGTTVQIYSEECDEFMRKRLWNKVKITILRRDGYACQECGRSYKEMGRAKGGRSGLEVHHIVPRSLGGTDHPGNLKTICRKCHKRHTDSTMDLIREARMTEYVVKLAEKEGAGWSKNDVDDLAFND